MKVIKFQEVKGDIVNFISLYLILYIITKEIELTGAQGWKNNMLFCRYIFVILANRNTT